MKKKQLLAFIAGSGLLLQSVAATAAVMSFDITQTFAQGGVADLTATNISLDGAGSFTIDPGSSGNYFDFMLPGAGTFSTIDTQIYGYYFLDSYMAGETIGVSDFGAHSSTFADWDSILVGGQTAGVWGSSHAGYLGFRTEADLYGWIEYDFTRDSSTSTLSLLGGAYEDVAGVGIIAGGAAPVPEPGTMLLMGTGLLGLVGYNRKRSSKK